jgi:hypothetical protein
MPTYILYWSYRASLESVTDMMDYLGVGFIKDTDGGTGMGAFMKALPAASPIGADAAMPYTTLAAEAGHGRWMRGRSTTEPH